MARGSMGFGSTAGGADGAWARLSAGSRSADAAANRDRSRLIRLTSLPAVYWPEPFSVISTRRFFARPAGVSFEAAGSASPNPFT